jgi:hypothetical protein
MKFVPMVCRHLDWRTLVDNNQYGDGKWSPDVAQFMATINAKHAFKIAS